MDINAVRVIFLFGYLTLRTHGNYFHQAGSEEFCMGDIMDIRCEAGQVVVIDTARYGKGRCVRNPNEVTCDDDVITDADKWCTGREGCHKTIYAHLFRQDCGNDPTLSLHITYHCQQEMHIDRESCEAPVSITDTTGTILSTSLVKKDCAQSYSPLILQAKSGQRFNFTMLDASVVDKPQSPCPTNVGYVKDLANGRDVQICSGKQRHTQLLLSNGNRLELVINRGLTNTVLFQYQVIGCADLEHVAGAKLRRQDNRVTVECEDSGRHWELECRDNQWHGARGNCGKEGAVMQHVKDDSSNNSAVSKDVLVIIVGVVTLLASVAIACVGIVYLVRTLPCHRYLRNNKGGYGIAPEQSSDDDIVYNDSTGLPMQPISRSFVRLNTNPPTNVASPTVMTMNSNYENMSSSSASAKGALYETLELQALEAQGIIPPGYRQGHSRQSSMVSVPVTVHRQGSNQQSKQQAMRQSRMDPPIPIAAQKQKNWAQTLKMRASRPIMNSFRKSAPLPVPRVQSIRQESAEEQSSIPRNMSQSTTRKSKTQTAPRRVPPPPSPDSTHRKPPPAPPKPKTNGQTLRNAENTMGTDETCNNTTKIPTYSVPMRNSMLQSEIPDVVYQTTEASYGSKEGDETYEVPMQSRSGTMSGKPANQNANLTSGNTDADPYAFPPPPSPEDLLPDEDPEQEYIYTDMSGAGKAKSKKNTLNGRNKPRLPSPAPEPDPEEHLFASLDLSKPQVIDIPKTDTLKPQNGTYARTKPVNTSQVEESLYANLTPPPPGQTRTEFDISEYGALCEHSSKRPLGVASDPEDEDVYATAKDYYVLEPQH